MSWLKLIAMWDLPMSLARSYVEDTGYITAECTQCAFPSTNCLLFLERRARARSLAAARAEKKPRETIIIAMRAASSAAAPLMRERGAAFLASALWNILAILSRLTHSFVRAVLHSWSALCNYVALITRVCTYVAYTCRCNGDTTHCSFLSIFFFFFVGNAWFSNFA